MKKAIIFKFYLLFVAALCIPCSYAQDSLQWHLPETAKARLGKGSIREIRFSPDGFPPRGCQQHRYLALRYGDLQGDGVTDRSYGPDQQRFVQSQWPHHRKWE